MFYSKASVEDLKKLFTICCSCHRHISDERQNPISFIYAFLDWSDELIVSGYGYDQGLEDKVKSLVDSMIPYWVTFVNKKENKLPIILEVLNFIYFSFYSDDCIKSVVQSLPVKILEKVYLEGKIKWFNAYLTKDQLIMLRSQQSLSYLEAKQVLDDDSDSVSVETVSKIKGMDLGSKILLFATN
jgi:hypothetical protein